MSTSTTTNYGWTIPNDDELVKNGAAAIRTLGQAIDTTAAASFGGLALIETQSFSGVSSVSFTEKFTDDYTNYKFLLNFTVSGGSNLRIRLRNGVTDQTASNYTRQSLSANSTSVSAAQATTTYFESVLSLSNTDPGAFTLEVQNPKQNNPTGLILSTNRHTSNPSVNWYFGAYTAAYIADGISFIASANTMTGTIQCYGYKV
jgi:hypothetical protein